VNRRIASALIESIHRYRRNRPAWTKRIECRFQPTCSHFAEHALRERALPVALLLILGRLLRCNPLARRVSQDPVGRRWRFRPNSVRTIFAVAALTGMIWLFAASLASAQSLTGDGCQATMNTRSPAGMTKSNPLVVKEGGSVSVNGTVPASIASLPPDQITSSTSIEISFIEDLAKITRDVRQGTGPQWGGSVSVDPYLRFGGGLYKAAGIGSGTPGWSCTADGYIKLDAGNPLTTPAGIAGTTLAVAGGGMALFSTRSKETPSASPGEGPTADEVKGDFGRDVDNVLGVEPKPDRSADFAASLGCVAAALLSAIGLGPVDDPDFYRNPFGAGAIAMGSSRRVWMKGHPIAGFFSGLVAGLGLTVLAQQFAIWPLTIVTAIAFPTLVGLLSALRAWRGKPYKVAA
jgi:putative component of membrane protein insertase Oxa1/YidC/SpoIIIJ protein YidD